jgi:hypothetical protein
MSYFEEHYDEANAELRRMAAIAFEEESVALFDRWTKPTCTRLYIGSGEDFDAADAVGEPNHLFIVGDHK